MRVVVVEDEPIIREAIVETLRLAGHQVVEAADGETGLGHATGQGVDLVLLDLMLPRLDGFAVLARVRQIRPTLPVIILTAKGSEEDVVRGLREGADDYVVKPFGARELLARMEAVSRRSPARPLPEARARARIGDREVDLERREVRGPDGASDSLTEAEATLLSLLLASPGRPVSREELLAALWGVFGAKAGSRTVDMHISRLRGKLGDDGAEPRLILTIRGKGYLLEPGGAE